MIKKARNKMFFFDKFKIGQSLSRFFNCLIKSVLEAIGNVNNVDDFDLESRIEHISFIEVVLEVSATSQHDTGDIAFVVGNEGLNSHLADLSQVVVPFLLPETGKTH